MKIKRIFLSMMTVGILFTAVNIPTLKSPTHAVTVFSGSVAGATPDQWIGNIYQSCRNKRRTIPITYDDQGKALYYVSIPMENIGIGSTVTFKINEQVYGFGKLDGSRQYLDLSADEQSH